MKKIAVVAALAILACSKNACADGIFAAYAGNVSMLKVLPERTVLTADFKRTDTFFTEQQDDDTFLEVTRILMGPELSSEEFPNGSTDSYL